MIFQLLGWLCVSASRCHSERLCVPLDQGCLGSGDGPRVEACVYAAVLGLQPHSPAVVPAMGSGEVPLRRTAPRRTAPLF
ncbi:hypothetical protein DPMN_030784 [Dreissena polymorpha]|uniref:Secreted protein n=1 Tax=Dreissena polymorpha TaxID=45954 RepID=A0A9D4LYS1_DREPO|nr:hypothetical protein DPMN_030784 [Dreissena polymorpha]